MSVCVCVCVCAGGTFAAKTKKWLESKESRKTALLFVVLLGTCMMIGDGILTPAISGNQQPSCLSFFSFYSRLMTKQSSHSSFSDWWDQSQ